MEGLSIEEKAKRYDEAITKGKQIQNAPYTARLDIMKGVVEHLFPELAESEDERIRKEMIEIIKNEAHEFPSSVIANKSNSWIAWLEKQGQIFTKKDIDDAYLKGICDAKQELEKQDKQNSWSEEDEAIYYGVIETEQYMLDVVNGIREFSVGNASIKEECTRELNWLRTLKDRVQSYLKQQ